MLKIDVTEKGVRIQTNGKIKDICTDTAKVIRAIHESLVEVEKDDPEDEKIFAPLFKGFIQFTVGDDKFWETELRAKDKDSHSEDKDKDAEDKGKDSENDGDDIPENVKFALDEILKYLHG